MLTNGWQLDIIIWRARGGSLKRGQEAERRAPSKLHSEEEETELKPSDRRKIERVGQTQGKDARKRVKIFNKSLILAQDERWRRA